MENIYMFVYLKSEGELRRRRRSVGTYARLATADRRQKANAGDEGGK